MTELNWGEDGELRISGALPAGVPASAAADCLLVLRHLDGWDIRTVRPHLDGGSFSAAIPVGAMEVFGARLPLRDGQWELSLRAAGAQVGIGPVGAGPVGAGPAGTGAVDTGPVVMDGRRVSIGRKVYRCSAGPGGAGIRLVVGPALGVTERGRIRRRLLRDIYYRLQRLLPVRNQLLLSSFHGKQCADNPRGIADELRRRGDRRKNIWAINDWSVPVPEEASAVLIGTRAYFAALARSRYLVYNDHVPRPYRKRRGQRYVQTWHGTPLKRIGYDIGEPAMASGRRYLDYMAADVAQWDMLLSPNPFSTPIMRRAFRFAGEIAETGYPRDDALVTAAAAGDPATAVRERLGLPPGKRVAMYVPTWRDNQHDASGRYLLDFRLDLAAASRRLGAEWVLLIRGHHLMAGGIPAATIPEFTFDVTGYPDIGDLLLVTDVLVTDYSSVMFDFAPTSRPMLFFTYDLEQYRDQIRGFCFDFEAEAPGPLLATSSDVVAALADIDSVAAKYHQAAAAFAARFCPLDDGKAAARACDRIFGS